MYKCSFFSIRNDVPRFYKVLFQKIAPRIFFDHLLQANWSEYLYIQTDYQTVNRVNGRVKYFDKKFLINYSFCNSSSRYINSSQAFADPPQHFVSNIRHQHRCSQIMMISVQLFFLYILNMQTCTNESASA